MRIPAVAPLFSKVTRLAAQQQITYRGAMLSGLATNLAFGLLRAFVILALYQGRGEVNGLTARESITFIALSQALIAFLSIFGSYDLMNSVYTGAVGSDLLKPVHLFVYWMARDLGRSLVNLVTRGLALIVLYSLFFNLAFPARIDQWAALSASLVLAWLVSFAFRFLVNLASFWTPEARGIGRIAFALSMLFSGFIMPLRLYPDWFARLCAFTPFPSIVNTSVEVYLGALSGGALWQSLAMQAAWFLVLVLLCQAVLARGVRRLVIQGG